MNLIAHVRKLYWESSATRFVLKPVVGLWNTFGRTDKKIMAAVEAGATDITTRLAEILIVDPVIRVREFDGAFEIDARSHLFVRIVQAGSYEPELVDLCKRFVDPSRDAIDVGANIGFFSVFLAKLLPERRVLAVEPTSRAASRLRRNLALNEVTGRVEIFQGAASDQSGTLEINTIEGREEYSSLGSITHPSASDLISKAERVETATLDEIVTRYALNPGFVKIDVEGFEHLVLRGAVEMLRRFQPVVLSEISSEMLAQNGSSSADVIGVLREIGYDVFDADHPGSDPTAIRYGNIICFPKSANVQVQDLSPRGGHS